MYCLYNQQLGRGRMTSNGSGSGTWNGAACQYKIHHSPHTSIILQSTVGRFWTEYCLFWTEVGLL